MDTQNGHIKTTDENKINVHNHSDQKTPSDIKSGPDKGHSSDFTTNSTYIMRKDESSTTWNDSNKINENIDMKINVDESSANLNESMDSIATMKTETYLNKSTSDVFTMTDHEHGRNLCGSKDSGIGNISTKSDYVKVPQETFDEETFSDSTVDLSEEKAKINGGSFLKYKSTKDEDTEKLDVPMQMLDIPLNSNNGHRMSFMEEESVKDRMRLSLLKQCSAILRRGDQKYTKESLHKTFQDGASPIIPIRVHDRPPLQPVSQDGEKTESNEPAQVPVATLVPPPLLLLSQPLLTTSPVRDPLTNTNLYLLERIFRLFDADRKDYLVQEDWLEFLKERLTEEKQLDFVEQVESVAYVLCGNGVITQPVFQHIMQNKVVTNKLFCMVDRDNDGNVSADELMDFLTTATSRRSSAGFDKDSMEWLQDVFCKTVGDQQEITIDQFQKIVMSKNKFFTERVFQIIDEDESDSISLQEFIAAVRACRTPDDKLKFLFKVYDLDGDGLIQYPELREVMQACMEENGMQFSDQELTELTSAMFEDADTECRGAITYEALKEQLTRHGGLLENLTISIDRWMVPPKPSEPVPLLTRLKRLKPYQFSLPYFKNNYVYIIYIFLYTVANIGLFVARCFSYWETNWFTIFARVSQCLNFNCMWILVLMLRGCITQLRVRGLSSWLPLDHHIYLHKITGVAMMLFSIFHTIMHICNFSLIVVNDHEHYNRNNYSTYQWLLTETPGQFGLVGGCANPTGFALILILMVIYVCSQPFIRRRGSFQVFYWTHLLYVPFWLLLIFHAPNFWKWFIIPGTIYVIERILRLAWMRSKRGQTYITSGVLKPSRVTHLVIKRPSLFEFHAGDYVFVNIPAIATYEWHPFTISSAPEEQNHIWLHIRGVGQWTNRLYEYFEREQERLHRKDPSDSRLGRSTSKRSSTRSKRMSSSVGKKRSVDFSPESYTTVNGHDRNTSNLEKVEISQINPMNTNLLAPVTTMHKAIEKSRSMPDMGKSAKKKQRLQVLCQQMRSESMNNFGECDLKHDYYRDADAVYQCPHNKALADDFKYMRNKPTIIAFKTPSVEEYERRRSNESILTIARRRLSKSISPDKDVEGQTEMPSVPGSPQPPSYDAQFNYPVGKSLKIYIDGPYGTPSSHIFRAQHAVLIAAGIGVTPFASILKSIMYRYWNARTQCPNCHHMFTANLATHNMNLRKVDFFWINREQRSFEWFVSLLSNLEMEQAEKGGAVDRFLEMHLYITSALQKTDMKAVGLQLAMDLLHEKEKRDLITGLKTRTNAGRPNWDKVFQQLQEQHKGKVTVFYCGPPQLARILRIKCDQFNFVFRKEVF